MQAYILALNGIIQSVANTMELLMALSTLKLGKSLYFVPLTPCYIHRNERACDPIAICIFDAIKDTMRAQFFGPYSIGK